MEPGSIRCTSSVKKNMNMFLQVFNPPRFNRILLWIVWLTELVLDEKLAVNLINLFTFLFLSIIMTQGRWGSMVPDKIAVSVGKLLRITSKGAYPKYGCSCWGTRFL